MARVFHSHPSLSSISNCAQRLIPCWAPQVINICSVEQFKQREGSLDGGSKEGFATVYSALLWITLLDVITGKKGFFVDKPVGKPVEKPVGKLVDNFLQGRFLG